MYFELEIFGKAIHFSIGKAEPEGECLHGPPGMTESFFIQCRNCAEVIYTGNPISLDDVDALNEAHSENCPGRR